MAYMPNEELDSVRKVAVKSGHMSVVSCPKGTLSKAGTLKIELNNKITSSSRCDLTVKIADAVNSYPIGFIRMKCQNAQKAFMRQLSWICRQRRCLITAV